MKKLFVSQRICSNPIYKILSVWPTFHIEPNNSVRTGTWSRPYAKERHVITRDVLPGNPVRVGSSRKCMQEHIVGENYIRRVQNARRAIVVPKFRS